MRPTKRRPTQRDKPYRAQWDSDGFRPVDLGPSVTVTELNRHPVLFDKDGQPMGNKKIGY